MSHILFSYDPSLACTGWAVWQDGKLVDCGYNKTSSKDDLASRLLEGCWNGWDMEPDIVAIEWPQIYRGLTGPQNPNDLLYVAAMAGAIVSTCNYTGEVIFYKPREWKGSVKKDIMVRRILDKLDEDELMVYASKKMPKSYAHNAVDAIGVGMKALGRL